MNTDDARVAREAKLLTRVEVIQKALEKAITWQQAAMICQVSPRQMRRMRARYEQLGPDGLKDGRNGKSQPRRISAEVETRVCALKRDVYADFSIRHFHQFVTEEHGLKVSYGWTRKTLLAHGLAYRATGRGRYRRRRPRRPMAGMLVHLDASQHEWIPGLPMHDLVVALDDADGRILYARFFTEESTLSSLHAIKYVLKTFGRFCELYTDRASHFCNTTDADKGPDAIQRGTVPHVLETLGIRQILAHSPQARGRSERAFGTIQGRLPQELQLHGVTSYEQANIYLCEHFIEDFNRRFAVAPQHPESAFVALDGVDIDLLLSIQHERVVRNDNTVLFDKLVLQIPAVKHRVHFVRAKVTVHEFPNETLGISHGGVLLGRFSRNGPGVSWRPRRTRLPSLQYTRTVRYDYTVFFETLVLEVSEPHRNDELIGEQVIVHDYQDGTIDLVHDESVIGRYDKSSNTIRRRAMGGPKRTA